MATTVTNRRVTVSGPVAGMPASQSALSKPRQEINIPQQLEEGLLNEAFKKRKRHHGYYV